jgi:Family of unknown function (DUF6298)/Putative collagen-binding domain of a collagenase
MLKVNGSRVRNFIVLFTLAIALVCLPIVISKAPRLLHAASQTVKAVEKYVKFDLNPGTKVSMSGKAATQPLQQLRPTKMSGSLRVNPANPRYFMDGSGKTVYLTGSHTWQNLQDSGNSSPPPSFDYNAYLNFLQINNHNFFRLWTWEQPRWSLDSSDDKFRFSPFPYKRVGPELAIDGLPKFDLAQFNQEYFDRMRQRIIDAESRGIYVSIMLFNGWSVSADLGIPGGKSPWQSHPFNPANNISGISGDLNKDNSGEEVHELAIPDITKIQEAYVRKVIDTVNDLDNVLYEVSNESQVGSTLWQYHMIDFIKGYEADKPKHHPVGMTKEYNGENNVLYSSTANWISLNSDINNPPVANSGKVILADTDHLCGVCGDRQWVWKSFTRGENPIFMDVYNGAFDLTVEQVPPDPLNYAPWANLRQNLGYTLTYASRMNLSAMQPRGDLASSDYALANPIAIGSEYLVYLPSGGEVTVNLADVTGSLSVEWLNPENGNIVTGITDGGSNRTFVTPFDGDAVLYLKGI